MRKHYKKFFFTVKVLLVLFFVCIPEHFPRHEFPTFRVVIDPGHGGADIKPKSKHGDRYDLVSRKYLDDYKQGAVVTRKGTKIKEHVIVYNIAQKVMKILAHTAPNGDFGKFEAIARKYGKIKKRIHIVSILSRPKGITDDEKPALNDVNASYRMFDYPAENGSLSHGRISRINKFKPQLTVSIHIAESTSPDYKAMNAILAPSFSSFIEGLKYLRGSKTDRKFFTNSRISDWFIEDTTRSAFNLFLSDVSQYFTGHPLDRDRNITAFRGYRHNMTQWAYADAPGWEKNAAKHADYSPYSKNYRNVSPAGQFWDRERSKYESYRRDGGKEGFGGDNAYASYEIIRYILYSLKKNNGNYKHLTEGKPYFSIWAVPIYINAINAYFELGYFKRKDDLKMLLENQNEIAEGIAVGVYSLLAGIEPVSDDNFTHIPKGKRIDLEKYIVSPEKTYFDAVWDD